MANRITKGSANLRPLFVRRLGCAFVAASLALSLTGCPHEDESIALIGGGHVEATAIDRDPVALLPSSVLLVGYLDASAMFATSFGPDVSRIAQILVPLGPEANFVPLRDVVRLWSGLYAMQGADFCSVVQGNFDVDRIRAAADARVASPSGMPLVKTRYADNDMFTSGNIGFVVLTPHTMLSGNETGMRRALDRLRLGKLEHSIPAWMVNLMATPGASFALAGDLSSQAAGQVVSQQLPFLGGVQVVRTIGNFKPPGLNFAGTFTYADAASATTGASSLQNIRSVTQVLNLFGGSVPALTVAQKDSDVAFTLPLDDHFVRLLLGAVANIAQSAAPH